MAVIGRLRRRLAIAIVLTALIPVLVAIWLAESAIRQTSERFFMPEVGTRLDQSLELYQELAHAVKSRMRAEAAEIAARPELRQLAQNPMPEAIETELERAFKTHPSLVSLTVEAGDAVVAAVDRGKPLDPKLENRLRVELPLTAAAEEDSESDAAPRLIAVFAAERARFDELETMGQFVNTYNRWPVAAGTTNEVIFMRWPYSWGSRSWGQWGSGRCLLGASPRVSTNSPKRPNVSARAT